MAALTAASGMPIAYILLLPMLFAAGMSLVDTTDGVAMLGAYGWAFRKPMRKLYYNITITSISVLVALLIGGAELLAGRPARIQRQGRVLGRRRLAAARESRVSTSSASSW